MEINDYVRTKDYEHIRSLIAKVIDIKGDYIYLDIDKNTNVVWTFDSITKHSKDIIDLVEVGDIIEFKEDNDLYRVNCIPNEECDCNCFYLEFNYAEKYGVEDIMVDKEYMKTYLKSVLTKEQFEANAYTIEKER